MKITKGVETALTTQMNKEFASAYLYVSMSSYLESENYKGMANWMKVQAQEEIEHGMKIFRYILDRGGRPLLGALAKPKAVWKSAEEVFQDALKHEEEVTSSIGALDKATAKDTATHVFLHWFIEEQVEEESSLGDIVDRFKLMKGAPGALFMLDHQLSARSKKS